MATAILLISLTLSQPGIAQTSKATILSERKLDYFNSANGLEYYKRHLIAIGNEAGDMLLLDTALQLRDTIRIVRNEAAKAGGINLSGKPPDLVSTAIVRYQNEDILLIMGAGFASINSKQIYLLPLNIAGRKEVMLQSFSINDFFKQLNRDGLNNIRIHGSTGFGKQLILGNAGRNGRYNNHLILCDVDFWQKGAATRFSIVPVAFTDKHLRLSGLDYVAANDMLLFTATGHDKKQENYAGSIRNFSKKVQSEGALEPDFIFSVNELVGRKIEGSIESLCVERADARSIVVYLLLSQPRQSHTVMRTLIQLGVPASGN